MGNFFEDVIKKSSKFHSTNRVSDENLLEPNVLRKVKTIIEEAHAHGVDLMIFETYRSQERQKALFEQGASKLRQVGVHHYGLACDIVKVVHGEPSWKGSFDLLGHLATSHQLIWGGDWGKPGAKHSFVDAVHVQWCSLADQAKLFAGTWYPDDSYNPYKHL